MTSDVRRFSLTTVEKNTTRGFINPESQIKIQDIRSHRFERVILSSRLYLENYDTYTIITIINMGVGLGKFEYTDGRINCDNESTDYLSSQLNAFSFENS